MPDHENSYFHQALLKSYENSKDHPQYQHWLNYALSTNERGKSLIQTIKNFIPSLANKRHLDIGCGFGGASIAFASEGAESIGIDYDDWLLNFSRENRRDHPSLKVDFRKIDVMNWEQVKSLGKFDIITCDNVIEHVAEPGRLIALCSLLLNPEGLFYMTAPNAFSIGQIKKDCHYSLFGISLLDPDDGNRYVKQAINQPYYDVSWYYRYREFENIFAGVGLSVKLLNPYQITEADIDALYNDYKQMLVDANGSLESYSLSAEICDKVIYRLKHHIQMLETDILFCKELNDPLQRAVYRNQIYRDYHTELWYFVLRPIQTAADNEQKGSVWALPSTPIDINQLSGRIMAKVLLKKAWKRITGNV